MDHGIVVPLEKLVFATKGILNENLHVELTSIQRDKTGQLTLVFNQMTNKLRQNKAEINAASTAMQLKINY